MRHKEKIKNSIPGRRKKFKMGKAEVCVGNEQQTNISGTQKSRNPAQSYLRQKGGGRQVGTDHWRALNVKLKLSALCLVHILLQVSEKRGA